MKKYLLPVVALLVLVGGGGLLALRRSGRTDNPSPAVTASVSPSLAPTADAERVSYAGEEGVDALSLLKKSHLVTVKQYSFGSLVAGIDGIESTQEKGWIFYVNGAAADQLPQEYITKQGDQLEWRYEKIGQ